MLRKQDAAQVHVHARIDGIFCRCNGHRSFAHDLAENGFAFWDEVFLSRNAVDETNPQGFFSVNHGPSINHLFCFACPDKAGQTLGATESRNDAVVDFRLTKFGVVGSKTEITGKGQFAAAARANPLMAATTATGMRSWR